MKFPNYAHLKPETNRYIERFIVYCLKKKKKKKRPEQHLITTMKSINVEMKASAKYFDKIK